MKLIEAETTLVLAGAWNPAIVTPNWIAQYVLGFPKDKEFKVNLQMPVQALGVLPRYSFEDLTINAQPDSLIFLMHAGRHDQVQKSFTVARGILSLLVHTPLSGLGINLAYTLASSDGPLVDAFKSGVAVGELSGDPNCDVLQQNYKLGLKLTDHVLNIDVLKIGQDLKLSINHHFDCSSAAGAADILGTEKLFEKLRMLSDKMAEGLEKSNA